MRRPITRGDVVLVPFRFADLTAAKRRPAVVVWSDPAQVDFLLAFISSQPVGRPAIGELTLLPTHPEFAMTGLAAPSKVRVTKLVTLSGALLRRASFRFLRGHARASGTQNTGSVEIVTGRG